MFNFISFAKRLFPAFLILLSVSCQIDGYLPDTVVPSQEGLTDETSEIGNDFAGEMFRLGPWNIVYEETFESKDPLNAYVTQQVAGSHSFTTVSSPSFKGNQALRLELKKGDKMVTEGGGPRAEILFKRGLLDEIKSKEAWYSFALYAPSNDYKKDRDDEIVTQWKTNSLTPTASLRVMNDRFNFRVGHSSKIRTSDWDHLDLGPVTKDQWIQFVFHIVHSDGDDGLVEIWRNGDKVGSHRGKNKYPNHPFPQWKFGIYKSSWEDGSTGTSKRVLFFDNIRIGNQNATYEEMNPSNENIAGWGPYIPDIKSFTLINTISNKELGTIHNNAEINIGPLDDDRISLRANFDGPFSGSVDFNLQGRKKYQTTDNSSPYSLYGEGNGGQYYNQGGTPPGEYTLLATPYINKNTKGKAGNPIKFQFKIVKKADNQVIIDSGDPSIAPDSSPATPTVSTPVVSENDVDDSPDFSSNNLMGHWKLDEKDGSDVLHDHSGHNNHAQLLNASGFSTVSGVVGSAWRFSGDSDRYGIVPHNSSVDISNAITIAAWIRPDVRGSRMILSKGGDNGYELGIFNNGKIEFRFNRETDGWKYRLYSNKSYPTDGKTWMHVAVTFDGRKSTIYINGIADNTVTYNSAQIRSNNTPVQIGARDGINRWSGDLDDIRLYNAALSVGVIRKLAQ